MNEERLLKRLRKGSTEALEEIMEIYTPYLCAIVSNVIKPPLPVEDVEEVVSDSFAALWYSREQVRTGKLKSYLAAIARNKAISRLRSERLESPLEDDHIILRVDGPEDELIKGELESLTRLAVKTLPEVDREIFQRHYFLFQKTEEIAGELDMPGATVRTKLRRGREKLRDYLTERGYSVEAEND